MLRLLQEGEYYPLGSDSVQKSDARLVLATHRDLKNMVQQGTFRQDLYYRLTTHQLHIPPLRERSMDIPLLLEQFSAEAAENLHKRKPTFPSELSGYLSSYPFPGNVRELRALVFDAVARHNRGVLSMDSFLHAVQQHQPVRKPAKACTECRVFIRDETGERVPTLKEAETALIAQALQLAAGNQGIAAGYLGIQRSTLSKKLAKARFTDSARST